MAEIHINPNDIEAYIRAYSDINKEFVLSNYVGNNTKKTCSFFIKGVPCKVDIYIKKETVNIVCVGQNKETAMAFVDYLSSKGYSAAVETKQITVSLSQEQLDKILNTLKEEYPGLIGYECSDNNIYKFIGYNRDRLTLLFYPVSNKATIQGRPYFVYNVIMNYLVGIVGISYEDVIDSNNVMLDMKVPYDTVRDVMRAKLGAAYSYLDEALRKTLSGAICQQYCAEILEDYSGLLLGAFRCLEGYLTKILTQKFNYKLTKFEKFKMFKKDSNGKYEIENNQAIKKCDCNDLIDLYKLYSDKRNVYCHATVNPSMTAIITDKADAIAISDEILEKINITYCHFYGV